MVKTQLSASDEHEVLGAKSEIIYVRTDATSKMAFYLRLLLTRHSSTRFKFENTFCSLLSLCCSRNRFEHRQHLFRSIYFNCPRKVNWFEVMKLKQLWNNFSTRFSVTASFFVSTVKNLLWIIPSFSVRVHLTHFKSFGLNYHYVVCVCVCVKCLLPKCPWHRNNQETNTLSDLLGLALIHRAPPHVQ